MVVVGGGPPLMRHPEFKDGTQRRGAVESESSVKAVLALATSSVVNKVSALCRGHRGSLLRDVVLLGALFSGTVLTRASVCSFTIKIGPNGCGKPS